MAASVDWDLSDQSFLDSSIANLTDEQIVKLVSEWAAENRYIPSDLSAKAGDWDNEFTPYLREIMDCLAPSSPARKIWVRKGAQVGATTGLIENFIGYVVSHNPGGMLYVSADAGLTKQAVEMKVDQMLHHSGLLHLLGPPDGSKTRSGNTAELKQFPGGFLLAVGARNPGKLRSTAAKFALLDELDGMPRIAGGIGTEEGSPVQLIEKRTDNYEETRKILGLSTPLKLQTSLINPLFLHGDQRYYHVPCVHCDFYQPLDWHGVTEAGKRYGLTWDVTKSGRLITDSVGYICAECAAIFYNYDKSNFLPRGRWVPHAETQEEGTTSYHLPAFYSPVGMYSWTGIVKKWFNCWDVKKDKLKDIDLFQQFYNLERGLPFEERGESPTAERVRDHRRAGYEDGEIPNVMAMKETGAPVILLTCAVDVHGDRLDVEVVGWCVQRQSYSIEWLHFEGDPDDLSADGPWQELRHLIQDREWVADDQRKYGIIGTLIDVGWGEKADAVYEFCKEYAGGVYPVMGRKSRIAGSAMKEFSQGESATGLLLYNVNSTFYKDRITSWLKQEWTNTQKFQPEGYPNFPSTRGEDFYKEYEGEEKVELRDRITKQRKGFEWRRIGSRPNHAFDCRVYGMCAFDMIALNICHEVLELEMLNHFAFFQEVTPRRNPSGQWVTTYFSSHPEEVAA